MSHLSLAPLPLPAGFSLSEGQIAALEALAAFVDSGDSTFCLRGGAGVGKCLGLGTLVICYDGSVIPVEDVKAGDELMGPDSKPRQVLSTTRGTGPLYKVIPTKGDPWVCNDVHVLTLVEAGTDTVRDVPLDAYLRRGGNWKKEHKLFQPEVIEFTPASALPIDPYFMGVWYGDGTRGLTNVSVTKPDAEIEAVCRDMATAYGLRLCTYVDPRTQCPTHFMVLGSRGEPNRLLVLMRHLVGDAEFLPQTYLTASLRDRREFLAGLLDTDGHLEHNCYEITQNRGGVADGIAFLARSVGLRVTRTIKWVNEKPYHRLILSGNVADLPLRIARKRASPRKQAKNALRVGFRVEAVGEGEYAGFMLDGDGRFLLGDFTVTHNTYVVAQFIKTLLAGRGRRVCCAAPTHKACRVLRNKLQAAGIRWSFKPRETVGLDVVINDTIAALLGLAPAIIEQQTERELHFEADRRRGAINKLFQGPKSRRLPILVIDETSMVGRDELALIKEQLRGVAKLICVGDEGQLAPVNKEMIDFRADFDQYFELDEIVRQAEGSAIIALAWAIRRNEPLSEALLNGEGIVRASSPVDWFLENLTLPEDDEATRSVFIAYTNAWVNVVQDRACWKLYGHSKLSFQVGELVLASTPIQQAVFIADQLRILRISEKEDPVYGREAELERIDLPKAAADRRFSCNYLSEEALGNPRHLYNVKTREFLDKARTLQAKFNNERGRTTAREMIDLARRDAWKEYFEHIRSVISFAHPFAITSHKSQGSTYKTAVVHAAELLQYDRRALYVATTRPSERLVL